MSLVIEDPTGDEHFVGERGTEPITVEQLARVAVATAFHDALCSLGPKCGDDRSTWDVRWFQSADLAVDALTRAGLLQAAVIAAPSATLPAETPAPRVWEMPSVPEDVQTVRSRLGVHTRVQGDYHRVWADVHGNWLMETSLIIDHGPLTEAPDVD